MRTLTKEQLKRMNEIEHQDFVLINVLPRAEFNKQHIRTSINIPHEDGNFTEMVEHVAGTTKRKIVVYCASTECDASQQAYDKLVDYGFTDVYDYEGGTRDWFADKESRAA